MLVVSGYGCKTKHPHVLLSFCSSSVTQIRARRAQPGVSVNTWALCHRVTVLIASHFSTDENVQELAVELVQLGFISEVSAVHHDPVDLTPAALGRSAAIPCIILQQRSCFPSPSLFQGDQPRLASVLEEAFSKFYSRNGSLNPVTVSS